MKINKFPFTLRKGMKFRAIGNSNGHNYPIGHILVAERDFTFVSPDSCGILISGRNSLAAVDIDVLNSNSIKTILEEKKENEKKIKELEEQNILLDKKIGALRTLKLKETEEIDPEFLTVFAVTSNEIREVLKEENNDFAAQLAKNVLNALKVN